jgi:ADP-heptose:LPS heptosyltransferase
MSEVATLRSLPGDWIDRRGRPRPRFPVRRVLVIKPDHIGDLLVVDPAIAQLRQFFPEARIELICGTWNVALARRLGRFDAVHGVNLFHEVSGQQQDVEIAQALRRRGAEMLQALDLGPFDLAIDLRYDVDSRPLLKNIDARAYAGFGTAAQFPFLDVVLPMHHGHAITGTTRTVIVGRDMFVRELAESGRPPAGSGGELSSRRSEVVIEFDIQGAASPRQLGTAQDDRLLGIGVERVMIATVPGPAHEIDIDDMAEAAPRFHTGWSSRENWGTWSQARRARLVVPIEAEPAATHARIALRLRAHVNPSNPRVAARIGTGIEEETQSVAFDFPSSAQVVMLTVATRLPRLALVSPGFDLIPGQYRGQLRLYLPVTLPRAVHVALTIRSAIGHAALAVRGATLEAGERGIVDIPFECSIDVAGESLRVEVSAENADALEGARVENISFTQVEPYSTRVPVAHMGHWASLLVLRTAQVFSNEPPFRRSLSEAKAHLCDPQALDTLPEPVRQVRARIERWQRQGCAVIGLALGCNTDIRKWPPTHFVELAHELMAVGPVKLLFVGSPADAPDSRDACHRLGLDPDTHMICGVSRIEDLGYVLEKLDLFVGSNTGTTHFAGKVGVRTIGIYAGTNHPREWGPIGENASWIMRDEPCAPCHLTDLKECRFWHSCLANLLPRDVLAEARPEVLAILSRRERVAGRLEESEETVASGGDEPDPAGMAYAGEGGGEGGSEGEGGGLAQPLPDSELFAVDAEGEREWAATAGDAAKARRAG